MIGKVDWLLVGPIVYLLILGLVILRSVETTAVTELDFSYVTQVIAVGLGLGLAWLARSEGKVWLRLGFSLYLTSLALLVAVAFYGQTSGGATRWLNLGQFQLQPSELAKLALILVQARLLSRRRHELASPGPILLSALYLALPVLLIYLQPDLGTLVILVIIWLSQLLVSQLPKRTLVLIIGVICLSLPAAYPFLADYQRARIDTFFSPELRTDAEGYNVLQATIAIGSGGVFGKGLDSGTQSQLNFLPAQHTDFIFAVLGEKLGLVGALSVVLAFCVLLIRLVIVVAKAHHRLARLVGYGVIGALGSQFVINVGMNLGLTPVTGVPLPFLSAGGTHVMIELAMLGLLSGLTRK